MVAETNWSGWRASGARFCHLDRIGVICSVARGVPCQSLLWQPQIVAAFYEPSEGVPISEQQSRCFPLSYTVTLCALDSIRTSVPEFLTEFHERN